jgi:hypothetical protein
MEGLLVAPLRYRTGEMILQGDIVDYLGDRGEVEYVVSAISGDAAMDWHFQTNGPGVMVLEPKHFGRVYVRSLDDLVFVSRAPDQKGEQSRR